MARFEVTTDLIVHTRVIVTIDADSRDAALDAATALLPKNYDRSMSEGWKATVTLKPPKGTDIRVAKAYYFEQASGGDKVRKIA